MYKQIVESNKNPTKFSLFSQTLSVTKLGILLDLLVTICLCACKKQSSIYPTLPKTEHTPRKTTNIPPMTRVVAITGT